MLSNVRQAMRELLHDGRRRRRQHVPRVDEKLERRALLAPVLPPSGTFDGFYRGTVGVSNGFNDDIQPASGEITVTDSVASTGPEIGFLAGEVTITGYPGGTLSASITDGTEDLYRKDQGQEPFSIIAYSDSGGPDPTIVSIHLSGHFEGRKMDVQSGAASVITDSGEVSGGATKPILLAKAISNAPAKKTLKPTPSPAEVETKKLLNSEFVTGKLPKLKPGLIQDIGPSSDQFNCYAYAADASNPASIGWVEGNQPAPSDAKKVVEITSTDDEGDENSLVTFYKEHGWTLVNPTTPIFLRTTRARAIDANGHPIVKVLPIPMPDVPPEGLVAVYANEHGQPEHAALFTPDGVFAKMGTLGTFKFSSLHQMAGGDYGDPAFWFVRTP